MKNVDRISMSEIDWERSPRFTTTPTDGNRVLCTALGQSPEENPRLRAIFGPALYFLGYGEGKGEYRGIPRSQLQEQHRDLVLCLDRLPSMYNRMIFSRSVGERTVAAVVPRESHKAGPSKASGDQKDKAMRKSFGHV